MRTTLALTGLKNKFTPTVKYLYSDIRLDFSVKGLNLR